MALQKRSGLFALIVLAAGLSAVRADAGLIGSDLGWQYYGGGGAYNPSTTGSQTSGSFTDTGGVGGTFIEPVNDSLDTVFNIDATDTTITFDYSVDTATGPWSGSPLSLSPTIYDGIAVNLLSTGSFANVSIDPATNMTDFGSSDLSFTANQIQVDWSNLDFDSSTVVTLDVTYSEISAAPEPATYSLMILSLLGTALAARSGLKLR
jgi:hypothetical protein